MDAGGRFTTAAANGIVCAAMNELRELRRPVGLGQREFAALLSIPLETYGPWDSGRRVVSVAVLQRARDAVDHHQRQQELLPLDRLGGLAQRIGGAGKAVIYQWESRKRTPSPVLWQSVLRLERGAPRGHCLTTDQARRPRVITFGDKCRGP
jgi:hypothetical protein